MGKTATPSGATGGSGTRPYGEWRGAASAAGVSFTIPYPGTKAGKRDFCRRYGLNAYYAGKHWGERRRDAEALHALTRAALGRARVPRACLPGPVELRFFWDDGLDIDNHAAIAKAVVDALKGVLLPDDGPRYFRKVSHQFWDGGAIRVQVLPCREEAP